MLALLLALVVPFLAGFLLFSLLAPLCRVGPGRLILKGSLAVGWGLGVSSCLLFAWLVVAGAPGWVYVLADTGFFLILAAASLVVLSGRGTATPPAADPAPTGKV